MKKWLTPLTLLVSVSCAPVPAVAQSIDCIGLMNLFKCWEH